MAASSDSPTLVFVDGIASLGVHNGVTRIQFFKLGGDGKAVPALELLLPVTQLRGVVDGLSKSVPR